MANGVEQSSFSSPTSVPRPFPFLRLPKELREKVFETLFDLPPSLVKIDNQQRLHGYCVNYKDHPDAPKRYELGTLRVSKQMHEEAGKIFWKPFTLVVQYSKGRPGVFSNTTLGPRCLGPDASRKIKFSVFRALRILVKDYEFDDFTDTNPQHFVADISRALEIAGLNSVTTIYLEFDTSVLVGKIDEGASYISNQELIIDQQAGFHFGRIAINHLAKRLGLRDTFEGVKNYKVGTPGWDEYRWQVVSELATAKPKPPFLWNYVSNS